MADQQRLTGALREQRDQKVLQLFLAGVSYRQIGAAVGLRSASGVHRIVQREFLAGAQRRALLGDEALALHIERHERLLQAHWGPALKGDHRSAELCRRLLDQSARLHGLYADDPAPLPAPTAPVDGGGDEEDELARIRARRRS
ncbi:MAG: Uncharacterized protein JWQ86_4194 [Mycobacterium sp.]|nr:Uncharacterized protein [Mycobacterium sp.]